MFGYSYVCYCAIPKRILVLANFGAKENCKLLLCLRVMQPKTLKGGKWGKGQGGKGASRHTHVGFVGSVC
jgi:hypothetical protein